MQTKQKTIKRASKTLGQVFRDYKDKGLISIYLWGSIISPDFDPTIRDVDAIGILADSANFEEMDQMRAWLPKLDPELKRLQINFLYLSELKGAEPVRSRLARLHDAEQAVFDFPYWIHVCGEKFSPTDFPRVTPKRALKHQIALTETKIQLALNPPGDIGEMGLQYCCKGLAYLCYNIHKLSSPIGPFSYVGLQKEANPDTKSLVKEIIALKRQGWDTKTIRERLPFLLDQGHKLIAKYRKA